MKAAAAAASVLEIRGLVVRRTQAILRGIDWRIAAGQHWVIVGPNGCGKTSLLAALTGYLTPTAGTIEILGSRYGHADWRALRTRIGFVSNALNRRVEGNETALDLVASGPGAILNTWKPPSARDRRGAMQLLRTWNCGALADRAWSVLSQGERQRMLIARALLGRPALLLLDEPCAGLDPVARARLLSLVQALATRKRGPAIVLITHHVEEITPAFTHALLLRDGSVTAAGPIEQTLTSTRLSATFGVELRLKRTRPPRSFTLELSRATRTQT